MAHFYQRATDDACLSYDLARKIPSNPLSDERRTSKEEFIDIFIDRLRIWG